MKYQLDLHSQMLMEQYNERKPLYERLLHLACDALRQALDGQRVRVTAMDFRIKEADSLAGKLELKGTEILSTALLSRGEKKIRVCLNGIANLAK